LPELHGQGAFERAIEHRVSGRIDEIRQQDRVLFVQGAHLADINGDDGHGDDERDERDHDRRCPVTRDPGCVELRSRVPACALPAGPREARHPD
jgi:hypothetical protein